MCECIRTIAGMGYVQGNLLKAGQYFLYPITKDNKVGKVPLVVHYCPICGEKINK